MPDSTSSERRSSGGEPTVPRGAIEGPGDDGPPHPLHETETIIGPPGAGRAPADRPASDAPATAAPDLSEFRGALVEIGVIGAEELDALAAGVPESEGILGLARALQKSGRLTAYQAAALYQRKSRGLLIGNYLILDKLGAGGMGVVFKGRHRRLGRVVALKILPPSFARDRTAVARFKREVEAAGRLKHPNIVAALDADEDRGVHFLVMEYVEGRDLDQVVRQRGPLPIVQAIDYLVQAARGLEAAHADGIVHRDIKPSNLMLDSAGVVRVLDLGLARIVDASNPFGQAAGDAGRLTESGMYMGTVDYMAPEQAEDSRRADHRADIYSLGCTLHYLLTGREPFVGETILKRLMAHQERPAPHLRAMRPETPAPLEDAFQKMMEKRPADRPESMTAVIALLEACRTAAAEAPRSSHRLKVLDNAASRPAEPPRTSRDASPFATRDEPEDGLTAGPELSFEDLVMDIRPAVPQSPPTIKRIVKPLATPPRRSSPPAPKPARASAIWKAINAVAAVVTIGLLGLVVTMALNGARRPEPKPTDPAPVADPSSKRVADAARDVRGQIAAEAVTPKTAAEPNVSLSPMTKTSTGRKRLTDDRTRPIAEQAHLYRAAFSPDGKRYATGGDDSTIRLFKTESGELIRSIPQGAWVQSLKFSGDGTRLFSVGFGKGVFTWDAVTGENLGGVEVPEFSDLAEVVFSPDGRLGICWHTSQALEVWDLTTGQKLHRLPRASGAGYAFTPDSRDVVIENRSRELGHSTIQCIEARSGLPRWSVRMGGVDAAVNGCWSVPSTGDLVTLYGDGKVIVRDLADGKELRRLALPIEKIRDRCSGLSPDGLRLLTGHDDESVSLWSLADGGLRRRYKLDRIPSGPPAFSLPDGRFAVAHSFRSQEYFWRLPEPESVDRVDPLAGKAAAPRPAPVPSPFEAARRIAVSDHPEQAIPLYEKELKERPGDPRAWVEYGQLLVGRGRSSDADTAFLRAARLAPGDFQPFLNDWWIVGPYAHDVRAMGAPQNQPDPSRPVLVGTRSTATSHWRVVRADPDGWVDLATHFTPSERVSAYALTYLYTQEEREVTVSLAADDLARVWLNGKLVFEHLRPPALSATKLNLMLQPGRNTLLIKVANDRDAFGFHLVPLASRRRADKSR